MRWAYLAWPLDFDRGRFEDDADFCFFTTSWRGDGIDDDDEAEAVVRDMGRVPV